MTGEITAAQRLIDLHSSHINYKRYVKDTMIKINECASLGGDTFRLLFKRT